jgi:NAD(P)-dependent dehydrogenase (short-subunit alcohol dehydrogenase family)
MIDYTGKVALVTGGASGIGAALATQLSERGADVVVADIQADLAREVAARLPRHGPRHRL